MADFISSDDWDDWDDYVRWMEDMKRKCDNYDNDNSSEEDKGSRSSGSTVLVGRATSSVRTSDTIACNVARATQPNYFEKFIIDIHHADTCEKMNFVQQTVCSHYNNDTDINTNIDTNTTKLAILLEYINCKNPTLKNNQVHNRCDTKKETKENVVKRNEREHCEGNQRERCEGNQREHCEGNRKRIL